MTCQKLFEGAAHHRKELDAPIRIYPRCHPKAPVDVFVDCVGGKVTIVCSKCDRTIEEIKVKIPFT